MFKSGKSKNVIKGIDQIATEGQGLEQTEVLRSSSCDDKEQKKYWKRDMKRQSNIWATQPKKQKQRSGSPQKRIRFDAFWSFLANKY